MLRLFTGLFTGSPQESRGFKHAIRLISEQELELQVLGTLVKRLETRLAACEGLIAEHYGQLHKLRGKVYGEKSASTRGDDIAYGDKEALRAKVGLGNGRLFKHDP